MNEKEIKQFITAFEDFMKHLEVEEFNHRQHQEYKQQVKMEIEYEIERRAAELEVTVDYYLEEFM